MKPKIAGSLTFRGWTCWWFWYTAPYVHSSEFNGQSELENCYLATHFNLFLCSITSILVKHSKMSNKNSACVIISSSSQPFFSLKGWEEPRKMVRLMHTHMGPWIMSCSMLFLWFHDHNLSQQSASMTKRCKECTKRCK